MGGRGIRMTSEGVGGKQNKLNDFYHPQNSVKGQRLDDSKPVQGNLSAKKESVCIL